MTGSDRDDALQTLAARPAFAKALLDAVGKGEIPSKELPVTLARQIQALGDPTLAAKLTEVWGTLRPTSKEKTALLARYKASLTPDRLAKADRANGRLVFKNTCGSCHKLFQDGGDLGPELTGSDRANLDYVLQNVLDPSATVGRDFRMTTVATRDGRVLSGLLRSQTDRTLVMQTVNERLTLDREDVEEVKTSESSVMPEGLFEKLSDDEVRDLVGYLGRGASRKSREFADLQPCEFNGRPFGFQAKIAGFRLATIAAGNFLAVDPQANLTVDRADIIMVPLAHALAQILGGKAAAAVGRDGSERFHLGRADGEHVTVSGEPVGLFAGAFGVLFRVAVVEHLHLNAAARKRARFDAFQRAFGCPHEHSRIPA